MKHWSPLVTLVAAVSGLIAMIALNSAATVPADASNPGGAGPDGQGGATRTTAPADPATSSATEDPTATEPVVQFPSEAIYTGKAANSELAIAVAVKGERAVAYLCDGDRIEAWLTGGAEDGAVNVASAEASKALLGSLDGDTLNGVATAAGRSYRFALELAGPPAGLYRGEGGDTTVGWIVLSDGSQVGIATTDGRSRPAPALDPNSERTTVDGEPVTVAPVTGDLKF